MDTILQSACMGLCARKATVADSLIRALPAVSSAGRLQWEHIILFGQ